MQPHAVAHNLGGDDKALDETSHGINADNRKRVKPVLDLHGGNRQGRDNGEDRAEVWNNTERAGSDSEEDGIIESHREKSERKQHRVTKSDQHLAAKKYNQVIVNRVKDENQFLLEPRFLYGQIIRPAFGDPLF